MFLYVYRLFYHLHKSHIPILFQVIVLLIELYFYEITKGNVDKSNAGIGIIPYIYDESRAYWYDRESRQKGIVADIERHIRMAEKRKQTVFRKTNERKRFEVDFSILDDLEEEDESNFS